MLPAASTQSPPTICDCGFAQASVDKVGWVKDFEAKWPAAFAFLRRNTTLSNERAERSMIDKRWTFRTACPSKRPWPNGLGRRERNHLEVPGPNNRSPIDPGRFESLSVQSRLTPRLFSGSQPPRHGRVERQATVRDLSGVTKAEIRQWQQSKCRRPDIATGQTRKAVMPAMSGRSTAPILISYFANGKSGAGRRQRGRWSTCARRSGIRKTILSPRPATCPLMFMWARFS